MPELHADLCFVWDETAEGAEVEMITVLVARERVSNMLFACALRAKGDSAYAEKRLLDFLREVRLAQTVLTVRSDGEVAMSSSVWELCRLRTADGAQRIAVENGVAERAVRAVHKHMRVARSALT